MVLSRPSVLRCNGPGLVALLYEIPSRADRSHGASEQSNRTRKAHSVRWSELRLVDLRALG